MTREEARGRNDELRCGMRDGRTMRWGEDWKFRATRRECGECAAMEGGGRGADRVSPRGHEEEGFVGEGAKRQHSRLAQALFCRMVLCELGEAFRKTLLLCRRFFGDRGYALQLHARGAAVSVGATGVL